MARTRTKIIEGARKVLVRPGSPGLALDEVARAAGVTRVTIYNHFRSKLGLISALFLDSGGRMNIVQILPALALPDPHDALHGLIRETINAWSRDRAVLQRVIALATVDPEARAVLGQFETFRRRDAEVVVARLTASDLLADGVVAAHAISAIHVLTSFQHYDLLVATGLSQDAIYAMLARMADAFVSAK